MRHRGLATYVATDIVAGVRYPGYSLTDQTVSELFVIGAPTSRVVVPLFALSSTLLGAFAFGTPPETLRVMPTMLSDGTLRGLRVPTLVPFGEQEVIYNPATALDRARRLMPDVEGDLTPDCRHDMCINQYRLVDARVLEFLKKTRTDDRAATDQRSVAQVEPPGRRRTLCFPHSSCCSRSRRCIGFQSDGG
jgi:pimeloyl-ACP methyl ester carboxylesterase